MILKLIKNFFESENIEVNCVHYQQSQMIEINIKQQDKYKTFNVYQFIENLKKMVNIDYLNINFTHGYLYLKYEFRKEMDGEIIIIK